MTSACSMAARRKRDAHRRNHKVMVHAACTYRRRTCAFMHTCHYLGTLASLLPVLSNCGEDGGIMCPSSSEVSSEEVVALMEVASVVEVVVMEDMTLGGSSEASSASAVS